MMLRQLILTGLLAAAVCGDSIDYRLDCLLNELGIDEKECLKRDCIWTPAEANSHVPWCYLDTNKVGYSLAVPATKRANGIDASLVVNPSAHKSVVMSQIEKLKLEVNYLSEHILRIRITDPAHKRYEVPVQFTEFHIPKNHPSSTKYDVSLTDKFNLTVTRKGTGAKIIDTSIGGLIYSDNFIQFNTRVATENVYGLGENYHTSFKHQFTYETFPLFARDRPMGEKERNNYGVHPFYTVVENDGKSHGVLLLNSNAMAYTFLPKSTISIKTLGGILDFFVFVGDNPEHVVQLYTSVIGRPVMPPFWGLGFQLCRYGYKSLDHVKKVVKRNLDNNVPIDVKYLDIDYFDERRDFTYDQVQFKGLPEYIKETKAQNNFKWTLIIDPAIEGDKPGYRAFDEGYKRDVFIKWPESIPPSQRTKPGNAPTDKGVMYGHVWPPGPAAFPDFFKNVTTQWWIDMHKEFHQTLNFDAIWIDMNEPANFGSDYLHCPNVGLDISLPSQKFPENLNTATLCMSAVQGEHGEYRHYDVHSLYGWSESKPTYKAVHAVTGKRGFVVSRSTYPSSGKYVAHWLGDNVSNWEQMRQSIIGMLEFSLFGISFTGADICGFIGNTTPELCRRWLQLGAYYPFSRSHNAIDSADQDPGYFSESGHPEVTKAAVDSLRVRYQLMHYLYTRFYRSHVHGETLVRPLHHEFPHDAESRKIDQQFFLGPSIMVNPFLFEHQENVTPYVPKGPEWYRLSGDFVQKVHPDFDHVLFPDSESHRPLLLRAGSILPIVSEHNLPKPLNTANLRRVPIELWVLPTSSGMAHGDLFYDDGESIDTIEKGHFNYYEFTLDRCHLTINAPHAGYTKAAGSHDILNVSSIHIAVPHPKHEHVQVTLNGAPVKSTIANHNLKIEVNLDLLHIKKSISINIKSTSNECIIAMSPSESDSSSCKL